MLMSSKLFFWNCQGAGHSHFHNFISKYRKEFFPDVICLFETKNSGEWADKIIARISMDKSFRVKENGFVGGIWILWNSSVVMDIICYHSQFIHMQITYPHGSTYFFMYIS